MSLTFHSSLINNFSDIIGGVNGTPANITWKSTNRGLKPAFDGSSSYIGYTGIAAIDTSDFTFAFYANLDSGTGTKAVFAAGEDTTDNYGALIQDGAALRPYISNGSTTINLGVVSVANSGFSHYVFAYDRDGDLVIYKNGSSIFTADISSYSGVSLGMNLNIGKAIVYGNNYPNMVFDDIRRYSTTLSAAEALALYNATSGEYGVRIAEFSHQHDPASIIPAQTSEVLRIGGKLAGDAVDTISDRSGKGNNAKIHGAMPTGNGFFVGGRRFDGVDDYLNCGNDSSLNSDDLTIHILFDACTQTDSLPALFSKGDGDWSDPENSITRGIHIGKIFTSDLRVALSNGVIGNNDQIAYGTFQNLGIQLLSVQISNTEFSVYKNGVLIETKTRTLKPGTVTNVYDLNIGQWRQFSRNFCGIVLHTSMVSVYDTDVSQFFNTLAALPFWSIDYHDYPDNATTYTDRFPHSSTIIASGAFKIDDDKLTCVAAGMLTYSASNEFDGAEYITVTIAGTEYSGTGTITQGNTTVSVAQGSNKITVQMGTGDTIDKIRIQFRATV